MNKLASLRTLYLAALLIGPAQSDAYDFQPTDAEWHSWPAYCQAKYVWTQIGRASRFANRVGSIERAELERWEEAGIRGIHHYCAGAAWLNRSQFENDSSRREFMRNRAREEIQFTLDSSDVTAPEYVTIAMPMATMLHEDGDSDAALELLQSIILAQPYSDVAYSATAVLERKLGRLEDARETLRRGYDATNGNSAEISYNLGLVSLELGEIEDAVKYAQEAYALGFPLPGLYTKLKRLGHM